MSGESMFFILNYIKNNLVLLILLTGMTAMVTSGRKVSKNARKVVFLEVVILLILSICGEAEGAILQTGGSSAVLTVVNIIAYILRPVTVYYLITFMMPDRKSLLYIRLLLLGNALIYSTALFSPIAFSIRPDLAFVRGPIGYSMHAVTAVMVWDLVRLMLGRYGINSALGRARPIVIFDVVSITLAALMDTVMNTRYVPTAIAISIMFFFLAVHLENSQAVYNKQQDLLKNQKTALMMSQIQPHFLYNALNTIYYLCLTDSSLAADTVSKFSDYMRNNLDNSLNTEKLVPVLDEIRHTRNYADIEMLRFENLRVEYEMNYTDFCLPALTIQPMVENAIRHGVRNKENGHVLVRTFRTDKDYVVQIIDNGIGYVSEEPQLGKHEHIGIPNVRSRLQEMCNGTLDILMKKDVGTTVTIRIPAQ